MSHSQSTAAVNSTMQHIWVITGPAGCGKSTVAQYLAKHMSLPYLEGDDYHPKANIDKMASGHPLTDADRWDWLIKLRDHAVSLLRAGHSGVVMTCSALKVKYRDVLRTATYNHPSIAVHFVYLHANQQLLLQRVKARQGHYMKDDMVKSQFNSLEEPRPEESDALIVDVSGPTHEVEASALATVQQALGRAVEGVHAETTP